MSPAEIVARGCDAIATALESGTDAARFVLRAAEARRLDALSKALRETAKGLRLGNLNNDTARPLVKAYFSLAFSEMGGGALSIVFGAIAAVVLLGLLNPGARAIAIFGFGALGFVAEEAFENSTLPDRAAEALTNGIFGGAEALADGVNAVINIIRNARESMAGGSTAAIEFGSELAATQDATGHYQITIYNAGNPWTIQADTNLNVQLPDGFDPSGDPKTRWNDDPPI